MAESSFKIDISEILGRLHETALETVRAQAEDQTSFFSRLGLKGFKSNFGNLVNSAYKPKDRKLYIKENSKVTITIVTFKDKDGSKAEKLLKLYLKHFTGTGEINIGNFVVSSDINAMTKNSDSVAQAKEQFKSLVGPDEKEAKAFEKLLSSNSGRITSIALKIEISGKNPEAIENIPKIDVPDTNDANSKSDSSDEDEDSNDNSSDSFEKVKQGLNKGIYISGSIISSDKFGKKILVERIYEGINNKKSKNIWLNESPFIFTTKNNISNKDYSKLIVKNILSENNKVSVKNVISEALISKVEKKI